MRRVVVADRQELARDALRVLVESTDDLMVVGEAADGDACVDAVRRTGPDAAVVDARLRTAAGQTVPAALAEQAPRTRVVVLATFGDAEEVGTGPADVLLLRDAGPDGLLRALRAAAAPATRPARTAAG